MLEQVRTVTELALVRLVRHVVSVHGFPPCRLSVSPPYGVWGICYGLLGGHLGVTFAVLCEPSSCLAVLSTQQMSDVSLTSSFQEIPSWRCESNRLTGLLAHSAYNETIVKGDDIILKHSVIYLKHINVKTLFPKKLSVV